MKKMSKSSGSSSQTTSHSDLSLWEEKLKAKPYAHFSAAANYYVAGLPYPPQQQLAAAGPPHYPQQQLAAAGHPHPPQQQLAAAGPPQQQLAAAGPPHPQQQAASRLFPHQLASDADSYQYPVQRLAASSCDSSVVYYQQPAAGNCHPSGPFYHYQQSSDMGDSSVQYYQQQAAGNCDPSMFHHQLPRAAGSALPYLHQQPAAGKSDGEPVTLFIGGVPFYLLEAAGATGTADLYEDVDSSDCSSDLGHSTTCLTSSGTSQCSSDLGHSSTSQGSCEPGTS
jgi:hypothetical protein